MKALVFTTYPLKNPRHGGQLRCTELLKKYNQYFSHVRSISIFNSLVYGKGDSRKYDLGAPLATRLKIQKRPQLEAWLLGEAILDEPQIKSHVAEQLNRFKPDVIIFEQPFLAPGVIALCQELELHPKIINSTQNYETRMMRDILEHDQSGLLSNQEIENRLKYLEQNEKFMATQTNGSIAVSELDRTALVNLGATNVSVLPNGVSPRRPSWFGLLRLQRETVQAGIEKYALFVGSAHQPNAVGFMEMMGTRLGFLPENSKIMIAGSVGRAIRNRLQERDPLYGELFWNRAVDRGNVSARALSALIAKANCVLLPITSGGGSNLKTAEAILSGRPIVSTTLAFRGFEKYLELPNVYICETPQQFQETALKLITNEFLPTDELTQKYRDQVTWQNSLKSLPKWLDEVLGIEGPPLE